MSNIPDRVASQAENFLSGARDTASAAAGAAQRHAGEIAEAALTHGSKMGEAVGGLASNFRHALDRSLERQPLTTVLLVAAAGLLLGGLLRR